MTTTRKIAREAGVSIGTVSRVLNGKPGVGEETRRRVLDVAAQLGHRATNRSLRLGMPVTHVGLLVSSMQPGLMANPFYADVYHGVEQICSELGINLAFGSLDAVGEALRSLPALVQDERIRGLVLLGAIPTAVIDALMKSVSVPVVLVDNRCADRAWDSVMSDNVGGVQLACRHLIDHGHTRIAFVRGPDHPSILERRAGYEAILHEHGLNSFVMEAGWLDAADRMSAIDQIVRDWPDVTALVCSNDLQAIGALKRLTELGVRVPQEISLIGFDNIDLSSVTVPPLSTVAVDRNGMGRLGIELLLSRINTGTRRPIRCIVGVEFVRRESVALARPVGAVLHQSTVVVGRWSQPLPPEPEIDQPLKSSAYSDRN